MKKYKYIASDGVLPIESFSLMGVSTKRDNEETIGMFGTGLKYAIAGLLKNNIHFFIISDGEVFDFKTKEIQIKGETFNQVQYKPEKMKRWKDLGFSAEMGLQWDLFDALREIVSNAIDEGGMAISDEESCVEGKTIVAIENTAMVDSYFSNIDRFFLFGRSPLFSTNVCDVYERTSEDFRVYCKGVLVHEIQNEDSLYEYDFKNLSIDERRKADYHSVKTGITQAIMSFPEERISSFINTMKDAGHDSFAECRISPYISVPLDDLDRWNKVIGESTMIGTHKEFEHWQKKINKDAIKLTLPSEWASFLPNEGVGISIISALTVEDLVSPVDYFLDDYEEMLLESALVFIKECGFKLEGIELNFYESKDGTLGKAVNGKIFLSSCAFRNGKKDLVNTIIHEYLHIKSGEDDESRGFEDYIISELVKQLELRTGQIL